MERTKYIAFLRGINVGGHHKVPMAELKKSMESVNFKNVVTLLNSGNVIFEADSQTPEQLEELLSDHLEKSFGFPIPTIVRTAEAIEQIYATDPFKKITLTKDTRCYISFLKVERPMDLQLPWTSDDGAYRILAQSQKSILSVLDISVSQTTKAMEILEKAYGKKNITTRNWKTVVRIVGKL